ncbi:glycosyltransferase family 25 protein [Helicobacter pametensis]|uniref:glycosyltransferase family 25 protein n=1 Tax=Helicobacter pametensis TaxID=95149 RepID=UPI0004804000|nr:glycosyltransferase family 25 protein [Helicobacter pametensis]
MKAYIINLPSASERKQRLKQEISLIEGIDFVFFDAISYRDERFEKYRSYWNWNLLTKLYRGRELTWGEKACFASHYALWERCVQSHEEMLILEDDILFVPDFREKILKITQNQELDFVRLMPLFQKKYFPICDGIARSFESICGTQGYFLRPRAALSFLKMAKIWFCPVDNYLDKSYLHGVKNLFCQPPIISENQEFQSCVDSEGGDRKSPIAFGYKISKECLNALEFVWRSCYVITNLWKK